MTAFGAMLSHHAPEEQFELVRRVEALGFDSVWTGRLSKRYNQDFGPLAQKYGVIGTPADCVEQLERFRAAGCDYFLLNPICDVADEREQLELMATEIIPRVS